MADRSAVTIEPFTMDDLPVVHVLWQRSGLGMSPSDGPEQTLLKLAREALDKADIPDLQSLFAENCRVERPTIPSVTGPTSVVIDIPNAKTEPAFSPAPAKTVTFDNWMDARGADSQSSGRKKKPASRGRPS